MFLSLLSALVIVNNAVNYLIYYKFNWLRTLVYRIQFVMSNFLNQSSNITSSVITLKSGDKKQCYEICEKNVTIVGSAGTHDHGSSKVKLKNIVDYKWETKHYPGHLIAVHIDGKLIAYVIKVNNKVSGADGMVRVANAYSGQRALIKGMSGEVLDLQFAHIEKDHILACIDDCSLNIHKIDMLSDNLICNLLLKIEDPMKNHVPNFDKVSWCPYVPDDCSDDDEDVSQLLIWSREGTFQCFNVNTIINAHGIGHHKVSDITEGYLQLSDNSLVITWIALSPDGTTLGVGSEDGFIRFYQIYFHEKEPRCLHQWNPHKGKAISSFFFLDNLTKVTDAYWKHALTGAEQNTEFKIWDCGTWECLQTVSITSIDNQKLKFLAEVDRTSSYLIASNLETRAMYVFQIVNTDLISESSENSDTKKDDLESDKEEAPRKSSTVFMKSVSEFPLSSPILSFSIVDAAVRKYKCEISDNYLLDEMDDYDEENTSLYCVVLRMFIIHPKSVQECHVLYQPTVDESCEVKSTISNASSEGYKDGLTDISSESNTSRDKNISEQNGTPIVERKSSVSPAQKLNTSSDKLEKLKASSPRIPSSGSKNFQQVNLMTPEAFSTSTGKKSPECVSSEVLSTILMLASVTGSTASSNKPENVNLLNLVNSKMIEDQEHKKAKEAMAKQKSFISVESIEQRHTSDLITSGGSSPSREVQEIMSLQDYKCKNYYNEDPTKENSDLFNAGEAANTQILQQISLEKDSKAEADIQNKSAVVATTWPKVPDVRTVTKLSTENQSSTNALSVSIPHSEFSELNSKINQLMSLVQSQSTQISKLKDEIVEVKNLRSESSTNVRDFAFNVEKQLSKLLEEYLIRYEKEHKLKLDAFIGARDTQNRELRDNVLHMLNQFLFNQFTEKLTSILIVEVQRSVVPVLVAKLEAIKQQIQTDVAQKLTTTDKILKDNISQVCKSQSIIDAFGNSVLLGVQSGLKATYVESMANTLIPAYEKSSQEMFKQLHDTFSLGIKEVMEQFDNYLSQLQPVQDGTDEVLEKISDLRKHIDVALPKQKTGDIVIETKKELKALETNLSRNVTDIIQREIKKGFESQAASLEDSVLSVVRSQAQTPAPSFYDVQDQIKNLLSQGQINKAFHQALLANDLSLVEYTLERADYKSVFNPCLLEQTVLLSLIQQISADMNNHNDIKQRYLADAILNLNQHDPITKEHAPKVMSELYRNCQCYLATNSKSPLCSNVRMIMMAVQGMGYKIF